MNSVAGPPVDFRHMLWLTAALALVAAPHVQRLPLWVMLFAATLALWRLYLGSRNLALPRKTIVLLVVILAAAAVFANYRTLFGRDAGVSLLVVMLALKLLETSSRRDAILLVLLAYFLIVTNFLYSQTIPTAFYMLGCLWVITGAMIACNHSNARDYRKPLRSAALMLAQAAPLMLALFLLFPRATGPLWRLPQDAHGGVSGLSDTMTPGSVARLTLSDDVAFRVEFKSTIPPTRSMYWRGPVLWDFDGRSWTMPRTFPQARPTLEPLSAAVEYTVTVEPHNRLWLFALDLPESAPPHAIATRDFQLRSVAPVVTRIRYDTRSFLEYRTGLEERRDALERALRLPENANPRTIRFANELRTRHRSDGALMRDVLLMFRNEKFHYTLEPPPLGPHSIDEFLFETRSGFCEHYASAFAFIMRAAGIPARIVTGYQGGEVNPFGSYLIVRQADAHAWTEVWLPDQGWVRVDPTAAVSPLRIQAGIAAAVPRTDPLPLLVRGDYPWLRQLQFTWDSLANRWNQWVLGYNPERQRWVLSRVGIDEATWRTLGLILVAVTTLVMALLLPFMLSALKIRATDPVARAYSRFCAKLGRSGLPRKAVEGPCDYAARLARARPELAMSVTSITNLYVALRYGTRTSDDAVRELERKVRQFSAWPTRPG